MNKYPIIDQDNGFLVDKFNDVYGAIQIHPASDYELVQRIPKTFHMIWLSCDDSIPHFVNTSFTEVKRMFGPHWQSRLHFWPPVQLFESSAVSKKAYDLYNELTVPAYKADLLRLWILHFFGGVYIDMDMVCLRPIDNIIDNCTGFTSVAGEHINNAYFGAVAGSPWIAEMIEEFHKFKDYIPGPRVMTAVTPNHKDVRIFNEVTFNPLHWDDPRLPEFRAMSNWPSLFYDLREVSYAVHLWNYSWKENK